MCRDQFLPIGGSLDVYGCIPEPVLGRIAVSVSKILTLTESLMSVRLSSGHPYVNCGRMQRDDIEHVC